MSLFARFYPATTSDEPGARRARRVAPGPKGWDYVRTLRAALGEDPLSVMQGLVRDYGDIVRMRTTIGVAHLFNRPEHVHHIFVAHSDNYGKGPSFDELRVVLGQGLITNGGALWQRHRRLIQPVFNRHRLAALVPAISDVVEALITRWQGVASRGEPVDVDTEMMRISLAVAGSVILGVDLSSATGTIGQSLLAALRYANARMRSIVKIPKSLPTPGNLRAQRAVHDLDEAIFALIRRRRSGGDERDLLSAMARAKDEQTGEGLSDQEVRDEVITLVAAGHETTANTLTWLWYLLSRHPEIERRLHAEAVRLGDARQLTADELAQPSYVTMAIEETLRLYPPVWFLDRVPRAADVIDGYEIPERSFVAVSPHTLHRHPEIWSDPERFDPERFSPAQKAARPRYAYIPFGAGERSCIGNYMSTLVAQIVVARVAREFRLELAPGHRVEPEAKVTLRPRYGMRMFVRRREAS